MDYIFSVGWGVVKSCFITHTSGTLMGHVRIKLVLSFYLKVIR